MILPRSYSMMMIQIMLKLFHFHVNTERRLNVYSTNASHILREYHLYECISPYNILFIYYNIDDNVYDLLVHN